ncbi:MAG: carboxypeptidase-like regulatory domain-containing protein, partial [Chitinophagales bacterium]
MKSIYLWLFAILPLCFSTSILAQENNNIEKIHVDGRCGMCKNRIEKAAIQIKGVKTATWNVGTKELKIFVNRKNFNEDQLHQKMADIGHDTEKIRATNEVYENLPGCCLYRPESFSGEASSYTPSNEGMELSGKVFAADENNDLQPLYSANVYWANTIIGTTTNENGEFSLRKIPKTNWLVVSFVGM